MPVLSIITINYNNLTGLQRTMESVLAQQFQDYEFIIIDGNSVDGSKDYIAQHAGKLAYWKSEKDNGVYSAMNKGILQAKGEYLLFLNSGDYFCDNMVLSKVFSNPLKEDIVYGNIIWDTNGNQAEGIFPATLSFEYFTNQSLPHQGTFIRSQLFKTVGLYDEEYPIIADWAFFLQAIYKFNYSYKHLDLPVSVCSRDGMSCDPANWDAIVAGRKKFIQKNFTAFYLDHKQHLAIKSELQKNRHELETLKSSMPFRIYFKLKRILSN